MNRRIGFAVSGLALALIALAVVGGVALADCTGTECLDPADWDVNPEGSTVGALSGDNGDNVIINDGEAGAVLGWGGGDYIENNGSTLLIGGGSGNDTIVINGTAVAAGGGFGDDTIIVNGSVGVVEGSYGSDTVIVTTQAEGLGGLPVGLDGGGGSGIDILQFDITFSSWGEYLSAMDQLANAFPGIGCADLNGQEFCWVRFEDLVYYLNALVVPNIYTVGEEDAGEGLITVFRDHKEVESGVVAYIDLDLLPTELFTSAEFTNGEMPGWLIEVYFVSNDYYAQHYKAYQINIYGPDGFYSDTQMLLISHVDGSVILFEREW